MYVWLCSHFMTFALPILKSLKLCSYMGPRILYCCYNAQHTVRQSKCRQSGSIKLIILICRCWNGRRFMAASHKSQETNVFTGGPSAKQTCSQQCMWKHTKNISILCLCLCVCVLYYFPEVRPPPFFFDVLCGLAKVHVNTSELN